MLKKLLSILAVIGMILGVLPTTASAEDASYTHAEFDVSYSLKWTEENTLELDVNADHDGTVCYLISEADAEDVTDSQALVNNATGSAAVSADTTAVKITTEDGSAKKVSVVYAYTDQSETVLTDVVTMNISAYLPNGEAVEDKTNAGGTVAYAANRSGSSLKLSVTPSAAGTAYYMVKETAKTAPTQADVVAGGTQITCKAETTQTAEFSVSNKDLTVYFTYVDEIGNTYGLSVINIAALGDGSVSSETGSLDFGQLQVGYSEAPTLDVKISNTGSLPLNFSVEGADSFSYDISSVNGMAAGTEGTLSFTPVSGLSVGTYDTTIIIHATDQTGKEVSYILVPVKLSVVENSTSNEINVTYDVSWQDASTNTVAAKVTSTADGTVHLYVTDENVAPSAKDVIKDGKGIAEVKANEETSITFVQGDSSKTQKVHVVFESNTDPSIVSEVGTAYLYSGVYSSTVNTTLVDFGKTMTGYKSQQTDGNTISGQKIEITNNSTNNADLRYSIEDSEKNASFIEHFAYNSIQQDLAAKYNKEYKIAAGSTETFQIVPKEDLDVGTYDDEFYITVKDTAGNTVGEIGPIEAKFIVSDMSESHVDGVRTPDVFDKSLKRNNKNNLIDGKIVYCINMNFTLIAYNTENEMDANYRNKFALIPDATAREVNAYTYYTLDADGNPTVYPPNNLGLTPVEPSDDDPTVKDGLRTVLYNGYDLVNDEETDVNGILSGNYNWISSDDHSYLFELATQCAIWHYTDKVDCNNPAVQSAISDVYLAGYPGDKWEDVSRIYNFLVGNPTEGFKSGMKLQDPPDDYFLDLYIANNPFQKSIDSNTGDYYWAQNLVRSSGTSVPKTSLTIVKNWVNRKSYAVEFSIYANDIQYKTITLDGTVDDIETSEWIATVNDLPKTDGDGNDITYTVKEITKVEGVTTTSSEYTKDSIIEGRAEEIADSSSHLIYISDPANPEGESVAYCLNATIAPPDEYIGDNGEGNKFSIIRNATASDISNATANNHVNGSSEEVYNAVRAALYYGYSNDANGLQEKYGLTDEVYRHITQQVIYYFTDSKVLYNADGGMIDNIDPIIGDSESNGAKAYLELLGLAKNAMEDPGDSASMPTTIYKAVNGSTQNLISGVSAPSTETDMVFTFSNSGPSTPPSTPDTEEISLTVAKHWEKGMTPSEVVVQLTLDGSYVEGKQVTLNESNNYTATFDGLTKGGNYSVREVILGDYTQTVKNRTVDENGNITIDIYNTENKEETKSDASITVIKVDADNSQTVLKGAEFTLSSTYLDGKSFSKTYTTDDNGTFTINTAEGELKEYLETFDTSKELTFFLSEKSAPDGYKAIDPVKITIDVNVSKTLQKTEDDNNNYWLLTRTYTIKSDALDSVTKTMTLKDKRKTGKNAADDSFTIYKTDAVDGSKLTNAVFTLTSEYEGKEFKGTYTVINGTAVVDTSEETLNKYLSSLPTGDVSFTLSETTAPTGYEKAEDTTVVLNISENSDWQGEGENKTFVTTRTYSFKIDANADDEKVLEVEDERITKTNENSGSLTVKKVNEEGKALKGAEFGLFDENGTQVASYTSGENGEFTISTDDFKGALPKLSENNRTENVTKSFSLRETKAPVGYVTADTEYTVIVTASDDSGWIENDGSKVYQIGTKYTVKANNQSELTVTDKKETVSIPVTKVWDKGASGENATVVLTQNGKEVGNRVELNKNNGWSYIFTGLDKYDENGNAYIYSVVEKADNYGISYVTNADGSITVVNSPKTTKTSLNVKKEWADGASGESATVVLTQNGTEIGESVELNEDNNWSYTFDNLDEYAADGTKYKYSVVEKTNNYQVSYEKNGNTVTVTNRPIREDKTQLVVNKEWADGASGESAAVVLTRNGEEVRDSVELNENNGWSYTFTDLDKYDENGNAYTYSVVEKADNYDISYVTNADGSITVVNRPSKETVSVPVVKKWADGASGESAAIVLTQNGSETGYTLTLNEDNSWSGSFDNLPKYDNSGKEYTYSVVEKTNSYDVNYVTNEDGSITVVNSPKTTKTSLNVKKEWADGASGESAVVVLTRNGEETDQTVTLNEGNNWSASFDDLDEYAAEGTKYKYSVVEKTDNYQVSYEKNGNTVTVTNRPIREDKTQLVVNKEWADGASGESAAVVLTRNGEEVGDSVELNENNGWSYTFTDLDKYDENGNAYTYSVVEKTNSYDVNYVTNDDGSITVVNSPKASTTSLIVKKEWADGASGESATVVVKNGDEEVARTVLNESNNWTDTFEDLPKYDNDGTEITYAVDEITSNYDYTVDKNTDGSYTITNSPKTTKTSLNVKKEWADGASGESAVVVLTRNGEETDQTVTLNEGNNWSASFDDLDEYAADGTKYEYSVVEKTNNYQVSYEKNGNTVTVTNRPIREDKTQLVVNKEWADGASGESAAVVLTRNGEEVGDSVELNENNGWSYTFTDLDKYDENGNAYTYSVVEKADNYDISYVTNADGSITVVNRPSKETVSVPVVKKWADGASGESAAIVLTQNGSETGYTLTLNEDNSWSGSFDNLPKYDNSGKEYTYSVVEKTNSYRYTVEEDGNGGYIVTNYPKPTLPRTYDETPKNDTSNGSETGTSSVKARLPLTGVENSTALYIAVMLAALALVGTASYLKHRKAK